MEEIFAVLARCPLFSGLDADALEALLPRLRQGAGAVYRSRL